MACAQSSVLQACLPLLSYEAFTQREHNGIVEGIEQALEGFGVNDLTTIIVMIAIGSPFSVRQDLALEHVMNDVAMDVGEPTLQAIVIKGQSFMIQAH